jgi:hypothetical protein
VTAQNFYENLLFTAPTVQTQVCVSGLTSVRIRIWIQHLAQSGSRPDLDIWKYCQSLLNEPCLWNEAMLWGQVNGEVHDGDEAHAEGARQAADGARHSVVGPESGLFLY